MKEKLYTQQELEYALMRQEIKYAVIGINKLCVEVESIKEDEKDFKKDIKEEFVKVENNIENFKLYVKEEFSNVIEEIKNFKLDVKEEFYNVRENTKDFKLDVKEEFSQVKEEIKELRNEIKSNTKWMMTNFFTIYIFIIGSFVTKLFL